jgi:hypothetical protein
MKWVVMKTLFVVMRSNAMEVMGMNGSNAPLHVVMKK